MSRSGYSDDIEDQWAMIRWRGAVSAAIYGKRGQAALREIAAALDAMPVKALVAESLATADGEFCTLGALGAARGLDMAPLDPDDWEAVAKTFGIAPALVREIVWENDETIDSYEFVDVEICGPMRHWDRRIKSTTVVSKRAPERRWRYMRDWVAKHIKPDDPALAASSGAEEGK